MRKNILLPALTLVGGGAGFLLRRKQLATGFEPDTGLAIPGNFAATALVGLTVVMVILLFALVWGEKERMGWDRAFAAAEGCPVYMTAMVLSAFLLIGSAAAKALLDPVGDKLLFAEGLWSRVMVIYESPVRVAISALGGACILLWGRDVYRGGERGKEDLPLLGLCGVFCMLLLYSYHSEVTNPVLMDYGYKVLAGMADLLGVYFLAGYSFLKEGGRPRRTLIACLMAVYFSLVALAGSEALADTLIHVCAILFLGTHGVLLLGKHPAGEVPAETEADKNAE